MKNPNPTGLKSGFVLLLFLTACLFSCSGAGSPANIELQFPTEHYKEALDGRLILLIAEENDTEPRFQLRDDSKTCQGFGMDVENWQPGTSLQFDSQAFGYPVSN